MWSTISGGNVLWVSPSGKNTNPGTESAPYQTIAYALKKAKKDAIRGIENLGLRSSIFGLRSSLCRHPSLF